MSSEMISLLLILSYILQGNGFVGNKFNKFDDKYETQSVSFSWSGCGSSSESIQVNTLSIKPDPLVIPGQVFVGTNFAINVSESGPLPLSVDVKKKVLFVWIKIPCEKGIGSCSYDDICQIVTQFQCPQAFKKYGIPCECPLNAGIYSLPSSLVLDIDKSILPSWLESGDYKARAQLRDSTSHEILCIDVSLSVRAKSSRKAKHFGHNYI